MTTGFNKMILGQPVTVLRDLNATANGKRIRIESGEHVWTVAPCGLKPNGGVKASPGRASEGGKIRRDDTGGTAPGKQQVAEVLYLYGARPGFSPSQYAKGQRMGKRTVCAWMHGRASGIAPEGLGRWVPLRYNPKVSDKFHIGTFDAANMLGSGAQLNCVRFDSRGALVWMEN